MPPRDTARDILLVGQIDDFEPFVAIQMEHRQPGCGSIAQSFGGEGKAMVLAQGDMGHPGYHLLLEWNNSTNSTSY